MAAADLLVAPSKVAPSGDKEGTPTVILEAMASGLPVLATRHAGIPEMVEDGREGCSSPRETSRPSPERSAPPPTPPSGGRPGPPPRGRRSSASSTR